MEELTKELLQIQNSCFDNESVKKNMEPFLEKLEKQFWSEAIIYYRKREIQNKYLVELADKKIDMLKIFFGEVCRKKDISIEFVLTSSLKSGINLIEHSDIDITMIVDSECSPEIIDKLKEMLIQFGFKYFGVKNDYLLFTEKTKIAEFEIKLRKRTNKTMSVISLHRRMDYLSEKEQIIITYGKLLFQNTIYYDIFKMLVYNMYFADIEGCHILK